MAVYIATPGCSNYSGSRDTNADDDGDVDMEDDDVDYTIISVDQWKWLTQFYRKLLVDVIRPLKIMMKMRPTDLDKSIQQKVQKLESEDRSNEAAEYFLNALLEYSDSKNERESKAMWSLFDEALKSEYKWLHCAILENGDVERQSQQQVLIQFFMDDIVRHVDPMHLMISLLSKNLLSTDECQKLTRIHQNCGNLMSCIYMINNVHRHSREWYGKLLEIMYENGYEELVKKIDDIEYGIKKLTNIHQNHGSLMSCIYIIINVHRHNENWYNDLLEIMCDNGYEELVKKINDNKHEKIQASRTEEHAHVSCPEEVYMSEYTEAHKSGSKNLCGSSSGQESDPQNITWNVEDLKNYRDEAVNQNLHKESLNIQDEVLNDFMDLKKVTKAENGSCFGTVNILSEDGANRKDLDAAKDFYEKNFLSGVDIDNSNAEVDPPEDDLADIDNDEDKVAEPIKLRDYQVELAELGLTGKNVVICAPTGSGKTLVALKIMRAHLEQQTLGVRKIVFLVNQVALADQQYKSCKKYLSPYRCHLLSSDNLDATKVPINELLLRKDVLVMTAQILLNALEEKEINSICEFSMVVFDECHHTHGRHPFNCIMHHYLDAKQSIQSQAADDDRAIHKLPQVIGMTASVGVGKASNKSQAVEYIRKLCAHLNADYICTVSRNTVQLSEYSNSPEYKLLTCQGRAEDHFKSKIEEIMKVVEENAENSEYTRHVEAASGIRAHLHTPCERGTEKYTNWITQLRRPVAMLADAKARQFLETFRCVLEFYNTSLLMNDDCDTQDAMEYLTAQFTRLNENTGNSVTGADIFIQELFEKNKPYLETVCQKQANTNPKLILLEGEIRKVFSYEPESRAIIFVKTRDMALCLERWMKRRPNLKVLKPGKIVGAGASSERGGMTKNQQVDVMQYFRDGGHKIMVATSVAEEGLDIRQCNLVIRYNNVTNEIAMVQARGRARAENSKFVTLASYNQGVAEKDEINIIREMMMHEAIRQLQEEMTTRLAHYHQTIIKIQAEEKEKRDIELAMMNGRTQKEGEVVLRCRKCDQFACMSSDIRTVEKAHHVIIDSEFSDRRIEKHQPKRIKLSGDMYQQGKLHCKNCGLDWGIVAQHSGTTFPIIKIDSFIVVDDIGRRDAPKKWKNTNFRVEELSQEELLQHRRRALASGRDAE